MEAAAVRQTLAHTKPLALDAGQSAVRVRTSGASPNDVLQGWWLHLIAVLIAAAALRVGSLIFPATFWGVGVRKDITTSVVIKRLSESPTENFQHVVISKQNLRFQVMRRTHGLHRRGSGGTDGETAEKECNARCF
jgi:hypothetical protein